MKVRDAWAAHARAVGIWDTYRSGRGRAFGYVPVLSEAESRIEYRVSLPGLNESAELEQLLRHAVQDARSALGNLIYVLGEAAGASPKQLNGNHFPVALKVSEWGSRRLSGLREEDVARIRDVQPFTDTNLPSTHPLEYLRVLSNADKHHRGVQVGLIPSLPPGVSQLATVQVTLSESAALGGDDAWLDPEQVVLASAPILDGDVVFSTQIPDGVDRLRLEASDLDLPLDLALFSSAQPERQVAPVLPSLDNALRFVDHTIRYITGAQQAPPAPFSDAFLSVPPIDRESTGPE